MYELEAESELRIEAGDNDSIQLKDGTAEIFGKEMSRNHPMFIPKNNNFAIFTWHGAQILVTGQPRHAYVATQTPMPEYLGCHHTFESDRDKAVSGGRLEGPRVLVAGPVDSGKSTLCKILINYAVRRGRKPCFLDLDIGQGSIAVPGTLSAAIVGVPLSPSDEGFDQSSPLSYFFGHVSPSENATVFRTLIDTLAAAYNRRAQTDNEVRVGGILCNTCGWIDGLGYELLVYAINALRIEYILVLDHDRLYHDLQQEIKASGKNCQILKLRKSGGVVERDSVFRRSARNRRIREYFYGPDGDLSPQDVFVSFDDIVVYRFGGGPLAPTSALPLGATPRIGKETPVEMDINQDLTYSVLAVSHSKDVDGLLTGNVAGGVDMEKRMVRILQPCPGMLPCKILIGGTLKWLE